jgi:hypothetical protein
MVYSSQEGEHIPGAKARLVAGLDVRDKSRTYLRKQKPELPGPISESKSQNCPGLSQKARARTARAYLRKQKQELPGPILESKSKNCIAVLHI